MLCSKFHYLNQETVFSGRKNKAGSRRGPYWDPEGGPERGPEGVQIGSRWGPKRSPDSGIHVFYRARLVPLLKIALLDISAFARVNVCHPFLSSIVSSAIFTSCPLRYGLLLRLCLLTPGHLKIE